jgi:hypothetical protein
MDTSEQPQRSPDEVSGAPSAPLDELPPPYNPPVSYPPTEAMPPVTPQFSAAPQFSTEEPAQATPGRMSRVQALDLISRLKATLVAGSVLAFGMFAALAVAHATGVTARSSASAQPASGSQGSQATPTAPSSSDDDGGFFGQSPSSGFGIGPPSSQAPAAGTTVS